MLGHLRGQILNYKTILLPLAAPTHL